MHGLVAALESGPSENGVGTLRPVISRGGEQLYRDDTGYCERHGVATVWEFDSPVLWIFSGDVGTFRVLEKSGFG